MDSKSIISAIDAEIATLRQARSLLASGSEVRSDTARRAAKKAGAKQPSKRVMSPEARKRIGNAQRKRWAAAKTINAAAPPKAAKKASPVKEKKAAPKTAAKRIVSPEARIRMAEAQRKRWATTKKAAPKKAAKAVPAVAVPGGTKTEAVS